jgi:hypothetical protein
MGSGISFNCLQNDFNGIRDGSSSDSLQWEDSNLGKFNVRKWL